MHESNVNQRAGTIMENEDSCLVILGSDRIIYRFEYGQNPHYAKLRPSQVVMVYYERIQHETHIHGIDVL